MNDIAQFVTKTVMLLFSVLLNVFNYIIQDINMIIYYDIVLKTRHLESKNNKMTFTFLGSAHLESVNIQLKLLMDE